MELMHNQVITISKDTHTEIYRIILVLPLDNIVIKVRIDTPSGDKLGHRGRPKIIKPVNNVKPNRLFTALIWANLDELIALYHSKCLHIVDVEPDAIFLKQIIVSKQQTQFAKRLAAMRCFLDLSNFKNRLFLDKSLGGLVKEAADVSGFSNTQIYKLFSALCRYGFTESSLRPRFDRCGSPGMRRPCDPGGRKKPGARTLLEKIELSTLGETNISQSGISTDWKSLILAADIGIKYPKPPMPQRCKIIINSSFVKKLKDDNGVLSPIHPNIGEYPNIRQIKRVLDTNTSRIEKLMSKTTKFHFQSNMRGLTSKNWEGVSGPGHTWAIDSTVGDIYLRSSVNRSWIVGRPIVYAIVDIWSTAIVGFYVCLTGPSWSMAKLALFCASANPKLIADMYGYTPLFTLDPLPTLPSVLFSDRGENLSKGASHTGIKIMHIMSYTPPYRGDLKGLVEVLHRIIKDQQFLFLPGAIDARRKEYEFRKFNRAEAILTLREYTRYLYACFSEYNLTANRDHRLDAHMRAQNVLPTPSGLWNWGHAVGIGFQKSTSQSELITNLLPTANVSVTRSGIMFGGNQYKTNADRDRELTVLARNHGGWKIPGHYFPGSVSKIWVPNEGGKGMLEMQLSDHSNTSPELSFDEHADALVYSKLKSQQQAHDKSVLGINFHSTKDAILQQSKKLTTDALSQHSESQPPIKLTRMREHEILNTHSSNRPNATTIPSQSTQSEIDDYTEIMKQILDGHNQEAESNANKQRA